MIFLKSFCHTKVPFRCSLLVRSSVFLLDLAGAGFLRAGGGFDGTADVDVEVIVAVAQIVEATFSFGERRQVEREVCGATETS